MSKVKTFVAAGLVATIVAGLLVISAAFAQQQGPPTRRAEQCRSVISQDAVNPILAKHRDRLQTARQNMRNEEQALYKLLVADSTTRAAVDAQVTRNTDARHAFDRARLDLLWDLRAAIPAQNREQAFRCLEVLMRRR